MANEETSERPVHKRRMRNFLLDRRFQLKYAGYMFGIAATLSVVLGFLLWNTSQSLIEQSRETVATGGQVVELGRKVADESRKVSAVVEMNIVEEYSDSPELAELFNKDNEKRSKALVSQQQALEAQAAALKLQSEKIEAQQRTLLVTLFVLLTLLAIGVGFAGIVVTHKVAGPIYKMTRQMKQLGDGNWAVPSRPREGDELVEFFETYRSLVKSLRDERKECIDELHSAVSDMSDETASKLDGLRMELTEVFQRKTRV
jgi:nitrogen fixation/metabolism regulation signal transduction histidine kinase